MSYLLDLVKRERSAPGDGLLGMLVREHGDEIDDRELAGLADGLLTGGLETTVSMLALGSLVLLRDPDCFAAVHDHDDSIDRFVEELLRYLTVVQVAFPRFAREDIEIGGKRISSGDVVFCSLSGANRDEALGAGMEGFDPGRKATSHLAFGHGIHRCIGAELPHDAPRGRARRAVVPPVLDRLRRRVPAGVAEVTAAGWATGHAG